jgi:hypothetical protein
MSHSFSLEKWRLFGRSLKIKCDINCFFIQTLQAVASCQSMGGELAQPSNEVDSLTLLSAIANFSLDTTATYWIGDHNNKTHLLLV